MMPVLAKLARCQRVRLKGTGMTGQYDDNIIKMCLKIVEGPTNFLDRYLWLDMGVSQFVDSLPVDVARRLKEELNSREL